MPKSVIKILGNKERTKNRQFEFQFVQDNLISNHNITTNEGGIAEIEHNYTGQKGEAILYLNGERIDKIILPGIYFYDEQERFLIRAYEFSQYTFNVNLNFKYRAELNPTSQKIYQYLNERYNDEIIIYDIEQEGSVKKKIVLYSTLIYMGIANYGSFRAGLRDINRDLDWLGNKIESFFSEDEIGIKNSKTKLVYPKLLSDEIEKIKDIQTNNPSTDAQQSASKIKELIALTSGKDKETISTQLNKMNIPLRTPKRQRQNYNFKQYGILREEENKTNANLA